MRDIKDHKDEGSMENRVLAFEVCYYMVHKILVKVMENVL
jgi:hypothetical protein